LLHSNFQIENKNPTGLIEAEHYALIIALCYVLIEYGTNLLAKVIRQCCRVHSDWYGCMKAKFAKVFLEIVSKKIISFPKIMGNYKFSSQFLSYAIPVV
jgi:phage-related holin